MLRRCLAVIAGRCPWRHDRTQLKAHPAATTKAPTWVRSLPQVSSGLAFFTRSQHVHM